MVTWLCSVGMLVSVGHSPAWASHCPSYTPWCRKFPLKQLPLQQGLGHWSQTAVCSLPPSLAVGWIWLLLLLLCHSRQWLWRPFCVCSGLSVQCSKDFICSQTARGYSAQILNRLNYRTCAAGMIWGTNQQSILHGIFVSSFEKLPVAAWRVHTSGSILAA